MPEVFAGLKKFQKRVNGSRTWGYNLSKIEIQERSTDDLIQWKSLPDFITAEFGWLLAAKTEQKIEWVKMKSQDLCDGQRIIRELAIFENWAFTVKMNQREIAKETLGICKLSPSKQIIRSLFHVLEENLECKGFQVATDIIAKDKMENIIGKTEEWRNTLDGTVVRNLRSVTCRVLIPSNYSRSSSQLCDECSRIKKNCSITCHKKTKSAPQMRESYMSKEELIHKLHEEKTRRLNAERRVDYWKDKIDNEMTTFVEEDHNDFLHMFKMVQKDSLDDDMKLFWEAQEKALLLQHKSKGYRWHPK